MEFTVIFLTLSFTWIFSLSAEDLPELLSTDACLNSGKQLVCVPGRILRIKDVICLPNNYTCPEKQRILDICDGQTSCSSVGLKNQIWAYCKGFTLRQVLITYRCVRDVAPAPCRTNLCSDESEGLFCRPGSLIHIHKAFCTDPFTECNWSILQTLYILCEGKTVCFASGLRLFMPNITCLHALKHNANLFVDYICLPETLSNDICTGQMVTLPNAYGIIKSPGFPENPYGNPNGCFWAIVPGKSQLVEIAIHVVFSRDSGRYLHITYTDCKTLKVKVEYCCLTTTPYQVRKSCGAMYIRHSQYAPGDQFGNRFVISYQVREYRSLYPSYALYMTQCSASSVFNNMSMVGSYVTANDRNELTNDGSYNSTDEVVLSSFDPDRFHTVLKVVVINFFLFIIAFWLVFAICLVCCRYCKLRKSGEYKLAMQSDTDSGHSGRRTDGGGTSLQTFSEGIEESPEGETCFNHIEKRNTTMFKSASSEGPYATVNKSAYLKDDVFTTADDSVQKSNRTSSFRPPKVRNPYASYDSLEFEDPDEVTKPVDVNREMEVSMVSKTTVDDFPPPPPPELLQRPPTPPPPLQRNNIDHNAVNSAYQNGAQDISEVQHYRINDDDYAIVQKPKRKPEVMPKPKQAHNPMYGQLPQSASKQTRTSPSFQPDVQSLPSSAYFDDEEISQKPQHLGYLPQHKCMLECDGNHPHNYPPPAPINRQRINGNAYATNTPHSPERTEHFY